MGIPKNFEEFGNPPDSEYWTRFITKRSNPTDYLNLGPSGTNTDSSTENEYWTRFMTKRGPIDEDYWTRSVNLGRSD